MGKIKMMIIFLCLLLSHGSVWARALKPVSQPAKPFMIAQGYVAQGQPTTQEPDDDDDDDDDDSDEDEDED